MDKKFNGLLPEVERSTKKITFTINICNYETGLAGDRTLRARANETEITTY